MSYIAVLGRQPELGIAELESLYPDKIDQVFGGSYVMLSDDISTQAERLGGTVKLTKLLVTLDTTDWPALERYVAKASAEFQSDVPEGKLNIGLSAYGFMITPRIISHSSLLVKKAVKATGRSVRLVPNTAVAMNSAQIHHNKLTGERGWELCFIRDGKKTHLAQTVWEQNIDAYAARDQARPMRDAKVGMLPPKLAQIIINLAAGAAPTIGRVLLDPFCGTGVVLQEASLMGFNLYGSDVEPRMIEYTDKNLKWLGTNAETTLETGDATAHGWQSRIDLVACETYLGKPFSKDASFRDIETEKHAVQQLLRAFLKNLGAQIKPGTRLCLAMPAWFTKNASVRLSLIDQLTDMGYTLSSFKHAEVKNLVYRRQDQTVGRQLIVITKD